MDSRVERGDFGSRASMLPAIDEDGLDELSSISDDAETKWGDLEDELDADLKDPRGMDFEPEDLDDAPPVDMLDPSGGDEGSRNEEDDAAPRDGGEASDVDEEDAPRIASTARETWIYAEPNRKSRRIGYLRAGSVVSRAEKPATTKGCKGGFYEVAPRGYVCVGKNATKDVYAPVVEASRKRPRDGGLPYDYVLTRFPAPPMYARLPSEEEQKKVETDVGSFQRKAKALARDKAFVEPPPPENAPGFLEYGRPAPGLSDAPPRDPSRLSLGVAGPRSGFALLSQFDHEGRRFGLTTDLFLVPLDRTRYVKQSTFHGLELGDDVKLPVAFVMRRQAFRYASDASERMTRGDVMAFRDAVPLTGRASANGVYLETRAGDWVRAEDVRRIDPPTRMPSWADGKRRWVDVSILRQALVAYEGTTPRYVTLVSTGADGIADPKETHATVQGVFLIHTKHVTVTMDGDEVGDEFDLRDVPFVQYFHEGYALHAAYWHDDFGTPRSHGCVNMSPVDAAWLFGFTTPDVPSGWHAALSLKKGTLVYTHP